MRTNPLLVAGILGLVFLGGCKNARLSNPFAVSVYEPSAARILPPPIRIPEMPTLRDVEFDLPRDLSNPQVNESPECKRLMGSEPERYMKTCVTYPPLSNTNIFVGVDTENWSNLSWNIEAMRQYIVTLRTIIENYNAMLDRLRASISEESPETNDDPAASEAP